MHALVGAVEANHLAVAIAKAVPVALRLIGKLVAARIHAAGCDLVQERFPDVRACAIDERDFGLAGAAELVAELRREFETARTTSDDDDAIRLLFRCALVCVAVAGACKFILASCASHDGRPQERNSPPVAFLTSVTIFWVIVSIA